MICGFQGEKGAFSDEAARAMLGGDATTRGFRTFDALLDALVQGSVDRALLPVENSISGIVAPAQHALAAHRNLAICEELRYQIDQSLIGLPGATIERLASVLSHPVALAQCSRFFEANPHIAAQAFYDTAAAVAEIVHQGDVRRAAIAPPGAAGVYGATILAHAIQDERENFTRFLLLSATP